MVVHLVLLRLKRALPAAEFQSFAQSVSAICRQIPAVRAAWVGPRSDIDAGYPRSLGETTYDYAAILRFDDREGLLAYLRHPSHAELGRRFWEICEGTVVFEGALVDLKLFDLPDNWSTDQARAQEYRRTD